MNGRKTFQAFLIASAGMLIAGSATASSPGLSAPHKEVGKSFKSQGHYSRYAGRNFPTSVYWGDTHLHTGMSMDAGSFGARLLPEDAYRFALGEEVTSSTGLQVKLSRPLDFLVVADHSDNMGFFPRLFDGEPEMLADPTGKRWYDLIQKGGQDAVQAATEVIIAFSQNKFPEALASLPGTEAYRDAWDVALNAAEKYNDPGQFTAFIGYEWTSNKAGDNRHRVIIYRDGADKASEVEPYTTLPPLGSPNESDLWKWMTTYEEKTSGNILAIAHNGNLSNGVMFPVINPWTQKKVDQTYVEERFKWEPLYEVTQIKGDGEAHPYLSPDDEFADYETWDQGNLDLSVIKENEMLQYEYARSALQIGMQLKSELGVNPYKFGLIGATDSHTGLATAQEDNFFGKHSGAEPSPLRWEHPMAKMGDKQYNGYDMVGSGLAGVWAKENTRKAIFDAMMRKETYATTGSRILVRFFGGWEFTDKDVISRLPADIGYLKGVPMGGDLPVAPTGKSQPTFLVAALKDPLSGNLDRIQIIKGWIDANGERQEMVYDVAWSDAEQRQPGSDGKLPSVGNTVNIEEATWTNTIGDPELIAVWTDPDFDPTVSSFYYARVIEIPTPRWTAYDAKFFELAMSQEVPMVTTERAYTSPIWYAP